MAGTFKTKFRALKVSFFFLIHCLKNLYLIVMNNFQCVSVAQKQIRKVFQEQIKINNL